MKSRLNLAVAAELRNLSPAAKEELERHALKSDEIVGDLAKHLLAHPDDEVRSRARVIMHTVAEMAAERRRMLVAADAHVGAVGGE